MFDGLALPGEVLESLPPARDHASAAGALRARRVLIAGSGRDPAQLWRDAGYLPTRLDLDPECEPDVVGSLVNLGTIDPFDVVYCSHALEHLYPHEVPIALEEFYRVLLPAGVVVVLVPDLEGVPATADRLPGSALCGLQLIYGDASQIPDHPSMAHHSGFVADTLRDALEGAGFVNITTRRMSFYNLLAIGTKP